MPILVTGGAGYIGSHTCVELIEAGYDVVVIDNECNSHRESIRRVENITGKTVSYYKADIRDREALDKIFSEQEITAVVHFAGLKAVGESVAEPLKYYQNNVQGTLELVQAMEKHGVFQLVFSSSATVYGDPASVPIREDFPRSATNPYGQSKLMIEHILQDMGAADERWSIALLRYFNPVGAHRSGLIGEDPQGIPNNLMPYISQVASGKLEILSVFGSDYPTPDGTGVRDYIHVVDLAKGHIKAVEKVAGSQGVEAYNLGTGQGYSVLEMVAAFERASGKKVNYQLVDRRPGDIATCYADPQFASEALGWQAELTLDDMTQDTWRWQSANPQGYVE